MSNFNDSTSEDKNRNENSVGDSSLDASKLSADFKFSSCPNFEDVRVLQKAFAEERNWNKYHTPRNLLLAMVGEVGELSEIFQWQGEVMDGLPGWSEEDKEHLGQELSDVLLYLIRLSEKCQIDLPAAVLKKISMNEKKYPAPKVWGSSKKYKEYDNED